MRTRFTITIDVEADENPEGTHSTDLRRATDLACDRMTEFDSAITIIDSDVDYTPDPPDSRGPGYLTAI